MKINILKREFGSRHLERKSLAELNNLLASVSSYNVARGFFFMLQYTAHKKPNKHHMNNIHTYECTCVFIPSVYFLLLFLYFQTTTKKGSFTVNLLAFLLVLIKNPRYVKGTSKIMLVFFLLVLWFKRSRCSSQCFLKKVVFKENFLTLHSILWHFKKLTNLFEEFRVILSFIFCINNNYYV